MPLISVIVPVYNAEEYLRDCINSILSQTFKNFEVILVNDGSSDNSGEICDKYSRLDSRVQVIHQENQGAASARNAGIKISKGDYICFVDADDLIHSQMLEILLNAIKGGDCGIAICKVCSGEYCPEVFSRQQADSYVERLEASEKTILEFYKTPYWCWVVWGRLIRASIVKNFLFVENRFHEDTITIQWLFEAINIAVVENELYFYRDNPKGISKGIPSNKQLIDGIWAVSEQLSYARNKGYYELEKQYISRFLYESAKAFFTIEKEDKGLALEIKKVAFSEWRKHHKRLQFKEGEEALVLEMFFPKIMWAYWKIKQLKHK